MSSRQIHVDERGTVRACRSTLARTPRDLGACLELIRAFERMGAFDDAVGAWCHYGTALAAHEQLSSASLAFRQALTYKPDCLRALIALGALHHRLGEPEKAIEHLERALAIAPDDPHIHVELGRARQVLGDTAAGWAGFAWNFRRGASRDTPLEQPEWDGKASLEKRRILVWQRFGLGDTILLYRYLNSLKRRGAIVILEASPTLEPLLAPLPDVDLVIPEGTPLPAFDTHVPLPLLPALLPHDEAAPVPIPLPYIQVDDELCERWRAKLQLDHRLTIGLVWAGDLKHATGRFRSMNVSVYEPLRRLDDVRWISLQFGPHAGDWKVAPLDIEQMLAPASCSAADTAAVMRQLDLVLTVDTMTAHLAGALGVPAWTLLPKASAWMWQIRTNRSLFYPAMELFRQSQPGDWGRLIEEVAERLQSSRPAARTRA